MDIFSELKKTGNSGSEKVAGFVAKHPEDLGDLLNDMVSENKRVKNAAAKAVRILSETHPEMLISHFSRFRNLNGQDDMILKWIAIDIIGNLSYVDDEGQINANILKILYRMVRDESMITAGHSVDALGKIAKNKNRYRKRITEELLQVEEIERNAECRNILLGKVIDSYSRYFEATSPEERIKVYSLVERQQENLRGSTCKRAEKFVKRHAQT